jgi:hypothetical protein
MMRLLCKLGFHAWETISGEAGIYHYYWRKGCKRCGSICYIAETLR